MLITKSFKYLNNWKIASAASAVSPIESFKITKVTIAVKAFHENCLLFTLSGAFDPISKDTTLKFNNVLTEIESELDPIKTFIFSFNSLLLTFLLILHYYLKVL
ncbi:hypothetical protein EMELA_v1c04640 [Mesoplasma melaleucae]|uniref:Uncharacterized protein n=1 Tax=Mesoplasma melaleucae TaxID=81459 RepID=A0A2K8NW65_9MOLU|nr:hypothetical protein EMELA_v1c04640 [Mesoplasma melaleucae]